MDEERIAEEKRMYRGKPPPRLMAEHELPEIYQIDLSNLKPEDKDDLLSTRPRERKSVIFYSFCSPIVLDVLMYCFYSGY